MLNNVKAKYLLELLICMIIIMLILSRSNFYNLRSINHSTQKSQLQTLKYLLNLTRFEAIKSGIQTYICPTKDQKNCANNWDDNIIIFNIIISKEFSVSILKLPPPFL